MHFHIFFIHHSFIQTPTQIILHGIIHCWVFFILPASLLNSLALRVQKHWLSQWRLFYLLHFSIFIANKMAFYCFGFMGKMGKKRSTKHTRRHMVERNFYIWKRASTLIYNRFYTSFFFIFQQLLQRIKRKLQALVCYLYQWFKDKVCFFSFTLWLSSKCEI